MHPNGICLTGLWQITEDTGYSGYFRNGSRALVVGRYRKSKAVGAVFGLTCANVTSVYAITPLTKGLNIMPRHNGSESSAPPRPLGKARKDLWDRVCCDFVLGDKCERETFCIIAEAADHAAELCAAIKKDGTVVETDKGARAHPVFVVVRQYRAFIVRNLAALKSHHRPTKVLGRPARSAMGIDHNLWEESP